MKKWIPFLILGLIFSTLGFAPLQPSDTLTPTDDTYVDINDPDPIIPKDGFGLKTDYSFLPNFIVTRYIYLRFDLSSVLVNASANSTLLLHVVYGPFNSEGYLSLWSTGDDWNGISDGIGDETTLKYINAPAPITKLDTRVATGDDTNIIFSSFPLMNYINEQRESNGGDNVVSFIVEWEGCIVCGQFDNIRFEDRENTYGSDYIPQLILIGPTAVDLSSYRAIPMPRYNQLEWTTAQELLTLGFNIFRSTSTDGEKTKINAEMIPARKFGSLDGDDYMFEDSTAPPGITSYYWLELELFTGNKLLYEIGSVDTYSSYFFPLIQR
jgi:hypothetical protein